MTKFLGRGSQKTETFLVQGTSCTLADVGGSMESLFMILDKRNKVVFTIPARELVICRDISLTAQPVSASGNSEKPEKNVVDINTGER